MPGTGSRILVLDDEPHVTDTLAAIFRMHGYEVQVAYSAEEAIETIAGWQPDLALVDVMLPGMNGVEFAIVLKENYPACRFLLLSGHMSTGELLQEAAKKGHNFEILAKPEHPAHLLERVRGILGGGPRGSA